jgi:hypothetical protein
MNFDAYKNKLPYPSIGDFTTTFWYKNGKVVARRSANQTLPTILDAYAVDSPSRLKGCLSEKVTDKDAFYKARQAYIDESNRLQGQFERDLLEDLGIAGHPKAKTLFTMAWERAHGDGFESVYTEADELADLIRD